MSKPASVVSFATTGGTRLEPTAPEKAAAFSNGFQPPARWHNWLFGLLGDWTSYLDNLHNEVEFLGESYDWTGSHVFGSTVALSSAPTYASGIVRTTWASMANAVPGVGAGGLYWDTELNAHPQLAGFVASTVQVVVPFRLPPGATLTNVRVVFFHGGAYDLTWRVVRRTNSTSGSTRGTTAGPVTVTNVSGSQVSPLAAPISTTVLEAHEYFVEFEFEDSGSYVQGVEVTWTDNGVQNQIR